jgi:RhoGAP domain
MCKAKISFLINFHKLLQVGMLNVTTVVFLSGLTCEGIYRISGVKSKVQSLKDSYNKGMNVYLNDHEPSVVASLLKQFLRELPEPVLTSKLMPKFEQASSKVFVSSSL